MASCPRTGLASSFTIEFTIIYLDTDHSSTEVLQRISFSIRLWLFLVGVDT